MYTLIWHMILLFVTLEPPIFFIPSVPSFLARHIPVTIHLSINAPLRPSTPLTRLYYPFHEPCERYHSPASDIRPFHVTVNYVERLVKSSTEVEDKMPEGPSWVNEEGDTRGGSLLYGQPAKRFKSCRETHPWKRTLLQARKQCGWEPA